MLEEKAAQAEISPLWVEVAAVEGSCWRVVTLICQALPAPHTLATL